MTVLRADLTETDVAAIRSAWDSYRLEPTVIYISPEGAATIHALDYMRGRLDLFGIRRWLVKRRYRREVEANTPWDDGDDA